MCMGLAPGLRRIGSWNKNPFLPENRTVGRTSFPAAGCGCPDSKHGNTGPDPGNMNPDDPGDPS